MLLPLRRGRDLTSMSIYNTYTYTYTYTYIKSPAPTPTTYPNGARDVQFWRLGPEGWAELFLGRWARMRLLIWIVSFVVEKGFIDCYTGFFSFEGTAGAGRTFWTFGN